MSQLNLFTTAAPATPAVGKVSLYIDTVDKKHKGIDEYGVISIYNNEGLQDLNVITNGGFSVQQRVATAATNIAGVSLTTRGGVVADRWAVTVGNITTPQWTQVDAITAPETGLVNRYYGRITQNTNAAKFILSQFLVAQDITHLRGTKVRLSVKIKNFVGANANYRLGLLQLSSAGGVDNPPTFISAIGVATVDPTWGTNVSLIAPDTTPTPENATVSGNSLLIASTAAWVRSSGVFSVPSSILNLYVVLFRDTLGAASDSLGIAEFQLTQYPDLVDFTPLPFALELARCQRFFCKTFHYPTVPATGAGVNTGEAKGIAGKATAVANSGIIPWRFPVRMYERIAPVITLFNPGAANALMRNLTGAADMGATAATAELDSSCVVIATGVAATAVGDQIGIHITADTEFVG